VPVSETIEKGRNRHAASRAFAVIAAATTAVGQEAQFPATAAGRHAGSPDAVLVVVKGANSVSSRPGVPGHLSSTIRMATEQQEKHMHQW
jgi:hypothetical protein